MNVYCLFMSGGKMFGFLGIDAIAPVASLIKAIDDREKYLNSLPIDEANKIRAKEAKDAKEYLNHMRSLEIAEAGRARNFWGK